MPKTTEWLLAVTCSLAVLCPLGASSQDGGRGNPMSGLVGAAQDLRPMQLAYGGADDPVVIAHVYTSRLLGALRAAAVSTGGTRRDSEGVAAAGAEADDVYVLVPDRPGTDMFDGPDSRVSAERLLVTSRTPSGQLRQCEARWRQTDGAQLIPALTAELSGSVFGLPAACVAAGYDYHVYFEKPALNTGGDTGREVRCSLRPARTQ